jgi:hypothetical protein
VSVGQPSSFVVRAMDVVSVVDIGLPDQILGPPRGRRHVAMNVAILRAIIYMERQSGPHPRCVWNASSNGHCSNLADA